RDPPGGCAVADPGAIMQPHPAPVAATRRRGASNPVEDRAQRGARATRPGDIGDASLWIPDIGRAEAFYAAVFGWAYEPSPSPRARQVPGAKTPEGLWGGHPR